MTRPTVIATLPKMPAGWTWSQAPDGHWGPIDADLMRQIRRSAEHWGSPLPPPQEPRSGARIVWPGVGELFFLPAVVGPWQYRADGKPGYERRDVRGADFELRAAIMPETDQWWWYAYDATGFCFARGPAKGAVDAQEQAERVARLDGWLLLEAEPKPNQGPFMGSMWYSLRDTSEDPERRPWLLRDPHDNILAQGFGGSSVALNYLHAAIELLGYEVPA